MARRFREKAFTPAEDKKWVSIFKTDGRRYFQVTVNTEVTQMAGDLAEKQALKGYDALHLSAAITLRKKILAAIFFSTADEGLKKADRKEKLLMD